jgi:small-conductance mechanosensitive channel
MLLNFYLHPYFKQIVVIALIIVFALLAAKIVSSLIKKAMHRAAEKLNVDQTKYAFIRHMATAIIYFIAVIVIIYSIPSLRKFSYSLFASAGILAAILGLASQQAFSNIVSGIFIVMSKPFKVGDRIELVRNLQMGTVEDITLRHTVIRDFQNRRIVIPNSVIGSDVILNSNLYDEKIRRNVDFSVDYSSDVDQVTEVIREECLNHPLCIDNRTAEQLENKEPVVDVRLIEFGASELKFRAFVWTSSPADAFILNTDLNKIIKKRFDKEGITIPFPQRVISYRNEEEKKR